MTENIQDIRTPTEKAEDAFVDYLKQGEIGSTARILMDEKRYKVRMTARSEEGNVSFEVLGRNGKVKDNFTFNQTTSPMGRGLELIKIL